MGLFPSIPVRSFADSTLNFERLQALLTKWGLAPETGPVATQTELAAVQRNIAGGFSAATPTVALAHRTAELKIKASTWTEVKCDTTLKDPGANLQSHAKYKAPNDGYYSVTATFAIVSGLLTSTAVAVGINVAGTRVLKSFSDYTGTGGTSVMGATASGIFFLKSGEEVWPEINHSDPTKEEEPELWVAEEASNRFSVVRVA